MKRRRTFLDSIAAVSLVLFLAACAGWMVSFIRPGHVRIWKAGQQAWYVGSGYGWLELRRHHIISPASATLHSRLTDGVTVRARGGQDMEETGAGLGFPRAGWRAWWHYSWSTRSSYVTAAGHFGLTMILGIDMWHLGYWTVVLATAPLAVLRIANSLKRAKSPPYACLTCGYDLRATPDRCPECGAMPVAHSSRPTG